MYLKLAGKSNMYLLLWLHIFVSIYCISGLHPKERINDELVHIKCELEDDPRFQQILVHPFDCAKYFLCNNGVARLGVCPMGLHFSNSLQICDHPEKVGCDRDKIQEKKLLSESGASVECPSEDGIKPTHLPHPSDCGKFYTCHAGVPHLKSCLPGLHFNSRLQVCDYPNRAGCTKIQSSKSRDKIIEGELIGCLTDRYGKHFIPNPHNCSEYTVCENGRTFTESCSSGLHFSVYTRSCDHPDKAKCTKSKQMSPTTSKQEGPGIPSPFCPTLDGKEQIFFNHPSNCSEYYMCGHGFAYKFACPARLHFNLKTKACDYEWLAHCQAEDRKKKFI